MLTSALVTQCGQLWPRALVSGLSLCKLCTVNCETVRVCTGRPTINDIPASLQPVIGGLGPHLPKILTSLGRSNPNKPRLLGSRLGCSSLCGLPGPPPAFPWGLRTWSRLQHTTLSESRAIPFYKIILLLAAAADQSPSNVSFPFPQPAAPPFFKTTARCTDPQCRDIAFSAPTSYIFSSTALLRPSVPLPFSFL